MFYFCIFYIKALSYIYSFWRSLHSLTTVYDMTSWFFQIIYNICNTLQLYKCYPYISFMSLFINVCFNQFQSVIIKDWKMMLNHINHNKTILTVVSEIVHFPPSRNIPLWNNYENFLWLKFNCSITWIILKANSILQNYTRK